MHAYETLLLYSICSLQGICSSVERLISMRRVSRVMSVKVNDVQAGERFTVNVQIRIISVSKSAAKIHGVSLRF